MKRKKLQFASQKGLLSMGELTRDFCAKILGYDFDGIFLSDESSLWDFAGDSIDTYHDAIRREYGVDASSVEDGNILTILRLIRDARP
ncbi:MAG TPA: hypothetical protein PKJ16_10825 [Spirochaetota bacterium]|nr:hypothetical protein [Spirochaetota bacterium]HPU88626.1 hypothetical protein [Spirochaetota bacterium]